MSQTLHTRQSARIGELLKTRGETVAVAESSTGGLVSASLLSDPGASAFFLGGRVVYTLVSRRELLEVTAQTWKAYNLCPNPWCSASLAGHGSSGAPPGALPNSVLQDLPSQIRSFSGYLRIGR